MVLREIFFCTVNDKVFGFDKKKEFFNVHLIKRKFCGFYFWSFLFKFICWGLFCCCVIVGFLEIVWVEWSFSIFCRSQNQFQVNRCHEIWISSLSHNFVYQRGKITKEALNQTIQQTRKCSIFAIIYQRENFLTNEIIILQNNFFRLCVIGIVLCLFLNWNNFQDFISQLNFGFAFCLVFPPSENEIEIGWRWLEYQMIVIILILRYWHVIRLFHMALKLLFCLKFLWLDMREEEFQCFFMKFSIKFIPQRGNVESKKCKIKQTAEA